MTKFHYMSNQVNATLKKVINRLEGFTKLLLNIIYYILYDKFDYYSKILILGKKMNFITIELEITADINNFQREMSIS